MRRVLIVAAMVAALFVPHHAAGAGSHGGCHDAVNFLWPARSRAWAHKIVQRESRGDPRAQNRRSSAAGCFQMLHIHAKLYERLGFSWADRYNPVVNTWVAMHLYRTAGSRPWR